MRSNKTKNKPSKKPRSKNPKELNRFPNREQEDKKRGGKGRQLIGNPKKRKAQTEDEPA
jgi:hypothetical protein